MCNHCLSCVDESHINEKGKRTKSLIANLLGIFNYKICYKRSRDDKIRILIGSCLQFNNLKNGKKCILCQFVDHFYLI